MLICLEKAGPEPGRFCRGRSLLGSEQQEALLQSVHSQIRQNAGEEKGRVEHKICLVPGQLGFRFNPRGRHFQGSQGRQLLLPVPRPGQEVKSEEELKPTFDLQ